LNNIPVLYELTVLHTEEIDANVAVFADQARSVRVYGDDIAVSEHTSNIALRVGKGLQKTVDVIAQTLHAIFSGRGMLDIGVTDITSDRTLDVSVKMRLLVEGHDDLLVLFLNASGNGHYLILEFVRGELGRWRCAFTSPTNRHPGASAGCAAGRYALR
jgi:hypothetical protein